MTAVSAFGGAEFDDVRQKISQLKKLETAPQILSWLLRSTVQKLAVFTIEAAQRVTAWACGHLERKANEMEQSVFWFRQEYDDFCLRLVRGPKLPGPKFLKQLETAREKTAQMVRVCRKNVLKSKTLSVPDSRLIRVYQRLVDLGLAMDVELQRYEETAIAASRCHGALHRLHFLNQDQAKIAANFNEDDALMNDPEIRAAAEAAIQRMQTRSAVLAK